jgi:hypothetical protein
MCLKLRETDEYAAMRAWRCGLAEEAGSHFCEREAASQRLHALSGTGHDEQRLEIIRVMAAHEQADRAEEKAAGRSTRNARRAEWCALNPTAGICGGAAVESRAAGGGAHRLTEKPMHPTEE